MLPEQDKKTILKELGLLPNERYKARFYMHKVFDREASCAEAEALAREAAILKSEKLGREIMPDLSPENLKRLGAVSVFNHVPWVEISRFGAKDSKSYPVNDNHKQQFPNEWAKFEAENESKNHIESKNNQADIREKRDNLRTDPSGPLDNPQGADWQSQRIDYTPTNYTISFS